LQQSSFDSTTALIGKSIVRFDTQESAMADSIVTKLKNFFSGNASVRKVAGDPTLTAELLLLFRVMLADGKLQDEEMAAFRNICESAFGIGPEDIGLVTEYLQDFGYEMTGKQAMDIFAEVPTERRDALVAHMQTIAESDAQFLPQEKVLIDKVAALLLAKP
jgi:uncharacterized tellurite resistance protein B-like protein